MVSKIDYDVLLPGEETLAAELILAVFREHVAPDFSEEGRAEFRKYVTPEALSERMEAGAVVLAARQDGRLAGVAEVRPMGHLGMLFVDSGVQGRGVGRALLRRVAVQCEAWGRAELTVNAAPNSVEFYRKQGFAALSEEQTVNGIRFVSMKLAIGGP